MCNSKEINDSFHFIGKCEIFKEFRLAWMAKAKLGTMDVIQLLNGNSWATLYGYITESSKYSGFLINEFNWK